jgi:hypothetical protein
MSYAAQWIQQTKYGECLLPFCSESFVFPSPLLYKTIILSFVLYGSKTWFFILKEEHILRVFENRVLRRIFGPKREEEAGGWRTLHNEELHTLYASQNIIRVFKSRSMR